MPQKCGTFILVPHVPQMWHKCGTQKRAHTFFLIKFLLNIVQSRSDLEDSDDQAW